MKQPDFVLARKRMVGEQLVSKGIRDKYVLTAMLKVPRHLFIEEGLWHQAYGDFPLPIGEGQTISQPYIVALMTEALHLTGGEKVLEIGTGSGYQTAILAELTTYVFSIERLNTMAAKARKVLDALGYAHVMIRIGDGTLGWAEELPFDAIIVTAGAPEIPASLIEQLAVGGRLVIPVGDEFSQSLFSVVKKEKSFRKENLGGVRFVKLIGDHGWKVDKKRVR